MSRVLLIEPSDDIRKLVAVMLRRGGHEVEVAADASRALEAIETGVFTCVIVGSPVTIDIGERRVLFLEYLEEYRPEWHPSLILITSWIENREVMAVAQRLDVCAVFAKPFVARDFLAAVDDCAAGRRPARRWYGIPEGTLEAGVQG